MKKVLFFVAAFAATLFGSAISAEEETLYLEMERLHNQDSEGVSRGTLHLEGLLTDTLGYYARYYQESSGFKETYVGPRFIIFSSDLLWLEAGVAIGREDDGEGLSGVRRNAYYFAENDKFYLSGDYEDGVTGQWHQNIFIYRATEKIGIGAMEESWYGFGPRLEFTVNDHITISGARLYEDELREKTWLVNITFAFGQ